MIDIRGEFEAIYFSIPHMWDELIVVNSCNYFNVCHSKFESFSSWFLSDTRLPVNLNFIYLVEILISSHTNAEELLPLEACLVFKNGWSWKHLKVSLKLLLKWKQIKTLLMFAVSKFQLIGLIDEVKLWSYWFGEVMFPWEIWVFN